MNEAPGLQQPRVGLDQRQRLAHAYDVSLGWAGDEQDGQAVLESALDGLELRCR